MIYKKKETLFLTMLWQERAGGIERGGGVFEGKGVLMPMTSMLLDRAKLLFLSSLLFYILQNCIIHLELVGSYFNGRVSGNQNILYIQLEYYNQNILVKEFIRILQLEYISKRK